MNDEQLCLRHVIWTMMFQVQSGHAVWDWDMVQLLVSV